MADSNEHTACQREIQAEQVSAWSIETLRYILCQKYLFHFRQRVGRRRGTHLAVVRCALMVAVVLIASGCSTRQVEEPAGREVYLRHCAACHGEAGRGDGPVAASLRRAPADLTAIAQRGGGSFDEVRVMQVIDGRSLVTEHGTRDMPVWGIAFEEELAGEPYAGYTSLLRSRNLTDYLRSIQR
jgi:mono/diheme cytochrome c family protein